MRWIVTVMILGMAGCATNTGVQPMGPNAYSVSVEREALLGGRAAARRIAFDEAADYCRNKGQQVQVTGTRAFGSSIVPDTGIDVQFSCVPNP